MSKLYAVFGLSTGPRCCVYESGDGVEFRRTGFDLIYIAPGTVRLEDGDLLTSATGHPMGRLESWVECQGLRTFWTDDLPAAVEATRQLGDRPSEEAA